MLPEEASLPGVGRQEEHLPKLLIWRLKSLRNILLFTLLRYFVVCRWYNSFKVQAPYQPLFGQVQTAGVSAAAGSHFCARVKLFTMDSSAASM